LKSSPLKDNIIIIVERYHQYVRIYYADGHSEIIDQRINNFQNGQRKSGYKNPICVADECLYPTMNQRDEECRWINLEYFEEKDPFFLQTLKKKGLFSKSLRMYLRYKEQQYL